MPPKPPASTFAPAALGAALLGLSAALFAVDVGGTVVLDTASSAPERTSANPALASAAPAAPAEAPHLAVLPRATVVQQPRPVPVSLARHVFEPLAAARAAAAVPKHRLTFLSAAEHPAPVEPHMNIVAAHAARPAVVALVQRAPAQRAVPGPLRPRRAVAPVASMRDVRHFAMRRLSKSYPNISVISAVTYSIGGNDVRVSMVVQNGAQRWVEKDVVKRSGTSLALEKSARHAMPYAVASTPQTLTPATPDRGP